MCDAVKSLDLFALKQRKTPDDSVSEDGEISMFADYDRGAFVAWKSY